MVWVCIHSEVFSMIIGAHYGPLDSDDSFTRNLLEVLYEVKRIFPCTKPLLTRDFSSP